MMELFSAVDNCMTPACPHSGSRRAENWPAPSFRPASFSFVAIEAEWSNWTPNAMINQVIYSYNYLVHSASISLSTLTQGGAMYQTESGYDLLEVISALQKEIRRGNEEPAMYWALELFPRHSKALWTRLRVIVNEDIGLGDPMASIYVNAQADHFNALEKEGSQRLVLSNTILYLSRAKKSRLADHFQCAVIQRKLQQNWTLEIPDYAKDKHTRDGKHMGRSWEHWFEHGCKLENEDKKLKDTYRETAESLWPTRVDPTDARKKKVKKTTTYESTLFDKEDT